MSSHSRVKGKAKKSGASSAKGVKKQPAPAPASPAAQADDAARPKLTKVNIEDIASGALTQFRRVVGIGPQLDTAAIRTSVDQLLKNIHSGVAADASEHDQAAQYILGAIVTALLPWYVE